MALRPALLLAILLGLPRIAAGIEPLTSIAAIRHLPAEVAASGLPVRIEGVVLGLQPGFPGNCFLWDGTASCFVRRAGRGPVPDLRPGDRLRIQGITDASGFMPAIAEADSERLGRGALPVPLALGADDLASPAADSAWITVPGRIVGITAQDGRMTLEVRVFGGVYLAEMPVEGVAAAWPASVLLRPVGIRAVLGTIYNRDHQMTGRMLFIPGPDAVQPLAPADPVAPAMPVGISALLTSRAGPELLVRLAGQVLQVQGDGFHLRDPSGCTFVHVLGRPGVAAGQRITVDGYGDFAPYRPLLRAVTIRPDPEIPAPPAPRDLTRFEAADLLALHDDLVRVEALVLGTRRNAQESVIEGRAGDRVFEALLPGPDTADLPAPGTRVALTGICEVFSNRPIARIGSVGGFRLRLAGPGAVTVLERAPWLTPDRLRWALALLALAIASGALWIRQLRAQVRRQLARLSTALRTETVAAERDRIARELHDTLEQNLTGVALQLDGVERTLAADPAKAAQPLALARGMLRQARAEARRSVWDLRSRILVEEGLEAALRDLLAGALPEGGHPALAFTTSGPARALPPEVAFQFFRLAQEALTNAVKHARAGRIELTLAYRDPGAVLTIRDDGIGFTPRSGDPAGGHFGLIGMEERCARIDARLAIAAAPGAGCSITVDWPGPSPRQDSAA